MFSLRGGGTNQMYNKSWFGLVGDAPHTPRSRYGRKGEALCIKHSDNLAAQCRCDSTLAPTLQLTATTSNVQPSSLPASTAQLPTPASTNTHCQCPPKWLAPAMLTKSLPPATTITKLHPTGKALPWRTIYNTYQCTQCMRPYSWLAKVRPRSAPHVPPTKGRVLTPIGKCT